MAAGRRKLLHAHRNRIGGPAVHQSPLVPTARLLSRLLFRRRDTGSRSSRVRLRRRTPPANPRNLGNPPGPGHTIRARFRQARGRIHAQHIAAVSSNVPRQLANSQDGSVRRFRFKGVIARKRGYQDLAGPIEWLHVVNARAKVLSDKRQADCALGGPFATKHLQTLYVRCGAARAHAGLDIPGPARPRCCLHGIHRGKLRSERTGRSRLILNFWLASGMGGDRIHPPLPERRGDSGGGEEWRANSLPQPSLVPRKIQSESGCQACGDSGRGKAGRAANLAPVRGALPVGSVMRPEATRCTWLAGKVRGIEVA